MARRGMLDVHRHEWRRASRWPGCRLHQQPQLRGATRRRRAHAARESDHRGGIRRRRRRLRPTHHAHRDPPLMPSTPIVPFSSRYVVLDIENIDTDQIIPARFLTTTERTGLGAAAFHDWRYDRTGAPSVGFPLNDPSAARAEILVTGPNFGCGSSREHAVWALLGAGFRAVVSAKFADIFRGNALANGLLPIQVDSRVVNRLVASSGEHHAVSVDLDSQTLSLPDGTAVTFPIAPFAKHCLLNGIDDLDFLLGVSSDVDAYEAANEAPISTHTAEAVA